MDKLTSLDPGWLVAVILFVLLILRDLVKKWTTQIFEWLGGGLYRLLAGNVLLRRRALSRYRKSVRKKYAHFTIPFLRNAQLSMQDVFVPLTAVTTGYFTRSDDAHELIRGAGKAVVVGVPGAGKSMLMRHAVLMWSIGRAKGIDGTRIPVLCELHRLNGSASSLEQQIVDQFARNDFPRATNFVLKALKAGDLAILFDGLDEVNSSDRPRAIQAIRDFVEFYPRIQIVVTCRTAVYDGQLAPEITPTFRVADFDERLIRRFLRQWPGIREAGQIEHLMEALRDAPRLMQLARNPLLLTMIAYLYGADQDGEAGRKLPHSRAEFYQEATDVLLRKLKDANNRYPGPAKRRVLQKLALAGMDAPISGRDRLTLPYSSVLSTMRATLPELNLPGEEAGAMLDEIVERSGLLIVVDGGDRYQFAHLTLQEFLAARELVDDPAELLRRYQSDPSRWRESIKLWCGATERDSTEIVQAVYGYDQLLGFECLSEAQVVQSEWADHVVQEMQRKLVEGRTDLSGLISAFGLAAADPRPRGITIFQFLSELANSPIDRTADIGANALAATNLPRAARLLAELAPRRAPVRDALLQMGDLAVPSLSSLARDGHTWAVDGLRSVGTPYALDELAQLLWVPLSSTGVSHRAAWHIAALLQYPEAEEVFRETTLRAGRSRPSTEHGELSWIWAPFHDSHGGSLPSIAAAVARLLAESRSALHVPHQRMDVDPRIALPLCIVAMPERVARSDWFEAVRAHAEDSAQPKQSRSLTLAMYGQFSRVVRFARSKFVGFPGGTAGTTGVQQPDNFVLVYQALRKDLRTRTRRLLTEYPWQAFDRRHWQLALRPEKKLRFIRTRRGFLILTLAAMIVAVAFAGAVGTATGVRPVGPRLIGWLELLGFCALAILLSVAIAVKRTDEEATGIAPLVIGAASPLIGLLAVVTLVAWAGPWTLSAVALLAVMLWKLTRDNLHAIAHTDRPLRALLLRAGTASEEHRNISLFEPDPQDDPEPKPVKARDWFEPAAR